MNIRQGILKKKNMDKRSGKLLYTKLSKRCTYLVTIRITRSQKNKKERFKETSEFASSHPIRITGCCIFMYKVVMFYSVK